MLDIIIERIKQKKHTIKFPDENIILPPNYRGLPTISDPSNCRKCQNKICKEQCPTKAILTTTAQAEQIKIDLGKCIFCLQCIKSCPSNTISFLDEYRLSTSKRTDLLFSPHLNKSEYKLANSLQKQSLKIFGRSLQLREVSAGGCNACEADTNVLNTLAFDLGRFGIKFVASPRHADGILVTGPVTKNMHLALIKTYNAIPSPKFVVAVGACAISGGLFQNLPSTYNGFDDGDDDELKNISVDLYIPGCPPHPLTILDGLIRLLGKTTLKQL
ncbi:MAG: 4Fe-4S dicluster domain-containing protein [Oligoflexia bacterium]|nr:4Fe-4S dicluster domain-containing protein [Oligoflexia bacterium]